MNRLFVNPIPLLTILKKSLHKQRLRRLIVSTLIKHFGLQVVTRDQLANDQENYHTLPFGSEEKVIANPPCSLEDVPKVIQTSIGRFTLKSPFVAEVKNVKLVGPTAVAFDEDKRIILESLPGIDTLPLRTLILKEIATPHPPELDIACSLINAHNKVYGHWLMDCLMRLEGLEYYQKKTGCKPTILVDSNLKPWQRDSLKLLGYRPDDYIQWKWSSSVVNVKRLIVPSFRRQGTWIEPKACEWLTQRMLSNLPTAAQEEIVFSPRIYISRVKKVGRKVINEDEVMKLLSPLGFVSYTPESINFADEVRLFSQAEIIIGAHGSGLINMIFSRNKLIIIDLFSTWYTNLFFNLSASLGFTYACLKCQPSIQDFSLTRADMIVDIAKLKQLIDKALLHSR